MVLGLCLLVDLAVDVHTECEHLFGWPSNVFVVHLVSCELCSTEKKRSFLAAGFFLRGGVEGCV